MVGLFYYICNMKKIIELLAIAAVVSCTAQPATNWAPVGDRIMTKWAAEVNPSNPLPEYPRPQLQRKDWKSINGLWDYAIIGKDAEKPETFDGEILVPFCIESALSGVGKHITADDALWYRTVFTVPRGWGKKHVWLNFQAVDWSAEVWVNGNLAGLHTGGYTAFGFDITPYLVKGEQTLEVKVLDATDNNEQPRGKQVSNPEGIWYTPVSGIWQSVWLEPTASATKIEGYTAVSLEGLHGVAVTPKLTGAEDTDWVRVALLEGGRTVSSGEGLPGEAIDLMPTVPKLWSPDEPNLYDLEITVERDGNVLDKAKGYTAIREVKEILDADGHRRLSLNGAPYFQFGPLDQGWWPDGLYTAPTDEALKYDIEKTKAFGFNMIRKHIKVEPARWYYWCDVLGIMVWQDMPCVTDSRFGRWQQWQWASAEDDSRLTESAKETYYKEWEEIIAQQQVFPCIVVWVPFNEAWAQFDTEKVVAFTKEKDPSRLVNAASGGNCYQGVGDIFDSHNYPDPTMKFTSEGAQIDVLGEYGGLGRAIEGHLWQPDRNWGYIKFTDEDEITQKYCEFARALKETVAGGVSAAVYTQTTDVEIEVNGLMTYDRAIDKFNPGTLYAVNREVIEAL